MTQEVFYRPQELARLPHRLPGVAYNLMRRLLRCATSGCIFVPIRSMQYLAVVDRDEVIFVDGAGDRSIELAWQNFQPQARDALTDPVAYEAVYYASGAERTMARLQGEFPRALTGLELRHVVAPASGGRVVKLSR